MKNEDLQNAIENQEMVDKIIKWIVQLKEKFNKIQHHIQLIQTYTDNELVLAQCNLILKEIEDE